MSTSVVSGEQLFDCLIVITPHNTCGSFILLYLQITEQTLRAAFFPNLCRYIVVEHGLVHLYRSEKEQARI